MLSLLIICLIAGGVGAILQGMIGIGTGIIIIPLLTFLLPNYGIPQSIAVHMALATSLAAIVLNSLSALISHHKRGNVQWALFKKIIIFSLFGSFAGAFLASFISGYYLERIFGVFMISLASYMFLKKSAIDQSNIIPSPSLRTIITGGFSIGFVGSVIGTGGGALMIPFLHTLKVKMRHAIGTTTLICLPVAAIGAITYIFTGLSKVPLSVPSLGYLYWPALLAISASGTICAPLGARLASVLPANILKNLFAACMVLVGLKMMTGV